MGGLLSGRRGPWGRQRVEVEESIVLRLYPLLREGVVRLGQSHDDVGVLPGPHGPVIAALISYPGEPARFAVACRYPVSGIYDRHELTCQPVTPRFGGHRWFLVCPLSGALVPSLYLPPGARQFGSRAAHRLAYRSERLSDFELQLRGLEKLARKLGRSLDDAEDVDFAPPRPCRMRRATYQRHVHEWEARLARMRRLPSWMR